MHANKNAVLAAVMFAVNLAPAPALAITAGEALELDTKHWTGFMIGATDMASHLFAVGGSTEKGQCVLDWFFSGDRDDALREIIALFEVHEDRDAVAVLHVLMNRKCGE